MSHTRFVFILKRVKAKGDMANVEGGTSRASYRN